MQRSLFARGICKLCSANHSADFESLSGNIPHAGLISGDGVNGFGVTRDHRAREGPVSDLSEERS
jgi:hypothetical protein